MSKIVTLFSVLAAFLLLNALPAFSGGTGPYGSFGPYLGGDWRGGVETEQVATIGGTGPYGSFGPVEGYNIVPGAEKQPMSVAWGSGPYGVFNPSGMVARDKSNKNECLVVAMNCPLR